MVGPLLFLFIHLLIPLPQITPYWLWAYYADPMQWATTMVMSSEFLSLQFALPCGEVPLGQLFFCSAANANQSVGQVGTATQAEPVTRGQGQEWAPRSEGEQHQGEDSGDWMGP